MKITIFWFLAIAFSYLLEDRPVDIKGNDEINISIVKRDQFSKSETQLFKKLYFKNQVTSFSYSEDGDHDSHVDDDDCYDDRLPTTIIVHKGPKCKESDKELVDKIRHEFKNSNSKWFSIMDEGSLFDYSPDTGEQEAIEIQVLQKKVLKNSVGRFLDKFNHLVYIVNGTELSN